MTWLGTSCPVGCGCGCGCGRECECACAFACACERACGSTWLCFVGESPKCASCGSESDREVGEAPRVSELAVETVEGLEAAVEGLEAAVAGREGEAAASILISSLSTLAYQVWRIRVVSVAGVMGNGCGSKRAARRTTLRLLISSFNFLLQNTTINTLKSNNAT